MEHPGRTGVEKAIEKSAVSHKNGRELEKKGEIKKRNDGERQPKTLTRRAPN